MATQMKVVRDNEITLVPFESRTLKAGDVVRLNNGDPHYIQYTNMSGAYAVPLAAVAREIQGRDVEFTAGGRTISLHSMVEHINPLTLGGNSPEYRRYVRMASTAREKGAHVAEHGVTFGEFEGEDVAGGGTPGGSSSSPKGGKVAKANGKVVPGQKIKPVKAARVAREKVAKVVRKCVCECGGETTGHFCPGHDARYHGWLKKLASGAMEPKDLPGKLRAKLDMKQTKEGFKVQNPEFYKAAD